MINFENSKFFYDPFPHCLFQEFLNKDVYNEMCNEFPSLSYFEEIKDKHKNDNKHNKFRFMNSQESIKSFNKFINTTKATKEFYNYLNSDEFILSIDKFLKKNGIELRFNNQKSFSAKKFVKNLFSKKLRVDFEFSSIPLDNGYLLPHTDGGNKLFGMVIPIIDNVKIYNAKNLGTKILKAKTDKYKFNFFNRTVPFEETELIRELPFKKNQMSIHLKTYDSLHAVGPLIYKDNGKKLYRKSITVFFLR